MRVLAHLPPLEVCIQVNVSGEATKQGVVLGEECALARAIAAMPRLRLRGLMAIPEATPDVRLQRERFGLLRSSEGSLERGGLRPRHLIDGHVGRFRGRDRGRRDDGASRNRHFRPA